MSCAWTSFLGVLPIWLRNEVDKMGLDVLQELRLRIGSPPELIMDKQNIFLERIVCAEDIQYCINAASQYSPWAARTISSGYLTISGGHRIGICGQALMRDGAMTGIDIPNSLCIRIARNYKGIAEDSRLLHGSVLILGKPGNGKTTLLRDLIHYRSRHHHSAIGVVDEKEELFPMIKGEFLFDPGPRTDVLSGCAKAHGIDCILRNMSVGTIAVDEITAESDCNALVHGFHCGVELLATAHASSKQDLFQRRIYKPLVESGIFTHLVILRDDKTWQYERMHI